MPSGSLAKCRVCNGLMNLLLQINGDLPDRFPGHERRLYLWACRKKTCRRKEGSVRAFRATRQTAVHQAQAAGGASKENAQQDAPAKPAINLGETLFGVKPATNTQTNPFASPSSNGIAANPFSASGTQPNPFSSASCLAAKPPQKPDEAESLPETFAQKARISEPAPPKAVHQVSQEPWPEHSAFPEPFPRYHLDADTEYIEAEPAQATSRVRTDHDASEGSSSAADDKTLFESSMDRTFQRFADRLSQNPEQVLRYDFDGQPLLYSKSDAVGRCFAEAQENANAKVKTQSSKGGSSKIPKCTNCGASRVFELQLAPHLITVLEADDMSIDGMDWGTIVLGVCSNDCQERGKSSGEVGYVEEWAGVQWEELANTKRPA